MSEISSYSSLSHIEFPRRIGLIKKLRYTSFLINDVILAVSVIVIIAWILHVGVITDFLFQKLTTHPFVAVLFLFTSVSLLFGAKRHLLETQKDAEKDTLPWWNTWIPMVLAGLVAVFGLMNFISLTNTGLLSYVYVSPFSGFCFLLIGLSIIPPFTRILHRFHITQLLACIVGGISMFIILENVYQAFSPHTMQHIAFVALPTALTFAFFSFGVLLRWSNRGFFGNFTLNATGSVFALRLFLINLFASPFIAFVVLFLFQKTPYNMYQVLTVIVVGSTVISCFVVWVNVKLLYRYELEHLLMRESLKEHNIDLTAEGEVLRKKMAQIEQEKQHYLDKLNTQEAIKNITQNLG